MSKGEVQRTMRSIFQLMKRFCLKLVVIENMRNGNLSICLKIELLGFANAM